MSDANTAISGSRDTTLRVWDIRTGLCRNVLVGHQASVRCLEIKGDIVVSGSYDTTARVWSISEGRCLHTLQGHYSQIYAIAFDGHRVATGSLDTSVRIWNASTGYVTSPRTGPRPSLLPSGSNNETKIVNVKPSFKVIPRLSGSYRCAAVHWSPAVLTAL